MGRIDEERKGGDRRAARNEDDRRAWRGKENERRGMGRIDVERKRWG
jgi:hypothetical protein